MSGTTYSWLLDEVSTPVTYPGVTDTVDLDLFCIDDLDPALTLVSDQKVLVGQRIARRLGTPRGSLIYDEDYGFDIRGRVNADMTNAEVQGLAANIQAECLKEEGVLSAKVSVRYSASTQILNVKVQLGSIFGEFPLTLSVSDVTLNVLHGEA